jgi:DNA ligase (NAD+)
MDKVTAKQRIEKLKKTINRYRYLYHVLDREEISPAALDSLKKELFDLEQQFPDLITADSPTQRVEGRPLEKFAKVEHEKPMFSLNDAFFPDDMNSWLERNLKLLTESEREKIDFFCEPKLDGLAIELVYKDGVFKIGSTRGDGLIGENVTQSLKTIESVPLKLRGPKEVLADLARQTLLEIAAIIKNETLKKVIVRGEAVITKREFVKVNQEREKQDLPLYANPRNLAAGSIRQLDPRITAQRGLDVNIYDLVTNLGQNTHQEEHKILEALGFKTNNKYSQYCSSLKEVSSFREYWLRNREKLPYEIDGIVVTINNNRVFEKLGVIGKAPRGAIAFKFPLKQATTRVQSIEVQVGRTGAMTPVAILQPVEVGGVTISRATLHNEDEIKRLGLKVGDTVVVGRAGDVIPDIIKVLNGLRTGKEKTFRFPEKCPSCQTPLAKSGGEVVWRCPNPNCFAKKREAFCHFVSKGAFDVQGLGPKIIDRLLDENLIRDPADLFSLKEGDISSLERFAEKSAQNIISAIQTKKKISFPGFLFALGIRNVGEETAQDLAEHFGDLKNLRKAGIEDLQKVGDVGPIVAQSIFHWFHDKRNLAFLEKLQKAGVQVESENEKRSFSSREQVEGAKNVKLRGSIFVFTGEMEKITRQKAKQKVRELGAKVSESVSRNTSYVVVGSKPGSKLGKAQKIGVKILSEKEFLEMTG